MEHNHDPYEALRHRDYRFLLGGLMLVGVGGEMQGVAVGWELYQRTHNPADLGYAGLVQFLPVLLLWLPAGHAADRRSRKGLMLAALLGTSLASLGLATLSYFQGPIPYVYLCLLLTGISRAFNGPARWALLSQVVPARTLNNAVTWNSSGWQLATVAGPALGGVVLWAFGGRAFPAYLLAAGCSLSCAALVALTRPGPQARPTEALSLRSFLAGIHFVWNTRMILATITLDLFAVLLGGATALLPIYATDILHVGSMGLGLLRAAPSLGAVLMAVALAHRPPLRRAGRALLWAVAGFGAATIVFGFSQNVVLSFAMLALTGALDNISVVVRGTLVQVLTPDAMRGRVSAVNSLFIDSSNKLGEFESGMTAKWFTPVASVVGGGVGSILVVLAVMLIFPEVLRLGSLHKPHEEADKEMDKRAG